MQLVVETLIQSLPAVFHVLMFGGFLFTVFGILGVQLFAGKFGQCTQSAVNGTAVLVRDQVRAGGPACT